ncbi:MAG: polysaccharide deacetylase family protein [Nitratireductor sp.]
MKQILAAVWLFLAIVANAEASPADDATAVLRDYYNAVAAGDCKRAGELRPQYPEDTCKQVAKITDLPQVTAFWEFERWVILRFNVAYVRSGKSEEFKGFVLLENVEGKWALENSSFATAPDLKTYVDTTIRDVFGQAFGHARKLADYDNTRGERQTTEAAASADPADKPDENASGGTQMASSEPVSEEKTVSERAAVEEPVPAAKAEDDSAVAPNGEAGDLITIDRDKEAPDMPPEQFPPEMLKERPSENCITPDDCVPDVEARNIPTERPSSATTAKPGEAAASKVDDTSGEAGSGLAPPGIETAGGQWPGQHGEVFGSAKILNACFDSKALRERLGEKKADKHSPLAFMGPPVRLKPKAPNYVLDRKYTRSIRRVNTGGRKLIALGFDIGEQNNDFAGYDGAIIDYLRANKVKATLYMGGKWMATHPERSMQLIADPLFEMGNHAWTHGNYRVLSADQIEEQTYFTEAQYELLREHLLRKPCAADIGKEEALKIPPRLMTFRFPYGTCRSEALDLVNAAGLPAVQWDTVTADPAWSQTSAAIAKVLINAKPGAIVVMHANGRGWNTAKALPVAIPELRRRGFEFVTVTELLQMGEPVAARECYERKPGDNKHYDRIFGRGTGD